MTVVGGLCYTAAASRSCGGGSHATLQMQIDVTERRKKNKPRNGLRSTGNVTLLVFLMKETQPAAALLRRHVFIPRTCTVSIPFCCFCQSIVGRGDTRINQGSCDVSHQLKQQNVIIRAYKESGVVSSKKTDPPTDPRSD